jgi:LmbE family N-acetylglucosaminyl deacetylase
MQRGASLLSALIARELPSVIYVPHPGDDHPDHRAALPMLRAAIAEVGGELPELRGYEVWSPMPTWDLADDITSVMQTKLAAIACYQSQLSQFRYDRAALGLNQYRGALAARCDFAEAFTLLAPSPSVNGH